MLFRLTPTAPRPPQPKQHSAVPAIPAHSVKPSTQAIAIPAPPPPAKEQSAARHAQSNPQEPQPAHLPAATPPPCCQTNPTPCSPAQRKRVRCPAPHQSVHLNPPARA